MNFRNKIVKPQGVEPTDVENEVAKCLFDIEVIYSHIYFFLSSSSCLSSRRLFSFSSSSQAFLYVFLYTYMHRQSPANRANTIHPYLSICIYLYLYVSCISVSVVSALSCRVTIFSLFITSQLSLLSSLSFSISFFSFSAHAKIDGPVSSQRERDHGGHRSPILLCLLPISMHFIYHLLHACMCMCVYTHQYMFLFCVGVDVDKQPVRLEGRDQKPRDKLSTRGGRVARSQEGVGGVYSLCCLSKDSQENPGKARAGTGEEVEEACCSPSSADYPSS